MQCIRGFASGSASQESTCKAGDTEDTASIPVSEGSPIGGNENPLQYS